MKRLVMLSLSLLVLPALAHADTVYTSAAAFAAASTGVTIVNFNGIAPAGGFTNETDPFTLNGATFSVPSTNALNITDATYYPVNQPGNGYVPYVDGGYLVANGSASVNLITITFAPSTAVGFSYGGIFGPGSFPVTLSDGTTMTLSTPDDITGTGSLAFIGFTSATPIDSITLDIPNTGNNGAIDNVSFGAAVTATPEPSSLLLLATGLAGAAATVRRKFRR